MARQFETEHEARVAGYIEPAITEINGIKVTTIEKCLERNCEGKYEWYSIVNTWTSSYWCTEDGEVLDELEETGYDYGYNCHCDTYGVCGGVSCHNYWQCHA